MNKKGIVFQSLSSGVSNELTPEIVKKIAEVDPIAIIGSQDNQFNELPEDSQNTSSEPVSAYNRLLARLVDSLIYIGIFLVIAILGSIWLFLKYNDGETYSKLLACSSTYSTPEQIANIGADIVCKNYLTDFNLVSLITYVAAGALSIVYFVVLTKNSGATLGKKLLKIKVVGENIPRITWIQSLGREFFWILFILAIIISDFYSSFGSTLTTFLFAFIILDFLNIFFSKNNTTIHDRISQTRVVKR